MSFWWIVRDFILFYYVSGYMSVEILMSFWRHLGMSILGLEFVEISEFLWKSFDILGNCWICWLLLSFCDFLLGFCWSSVEFLLSFCWDFGDLVVFTYVRLYLCWDSVEFLSGLCWVFCWVSVEFIWGVEFLLILLIFVEICWNLFFWSSHWNYEM